MIEDVLVKLDKLIFPVDFIALCMKEGLGISIRLGQLL